MDIFWNYTHLRLQHAQVTLSPVLKMNLEENQTTKSYFSCLLLSLFGFWVVLEPFQGFFSFLPLSTLKKREGWKLQWSLNTQHSTQSQLSWEYCKAWKFCFGRTNLKHLPILLPQSKGNRSFPQDTYVGKTLMFHHFECIPPSLVTHFRHQACDRIVFQLC